MFYKSKIATKALTSSEQTCSCLFSNIYQIPNILTYRLRLKDTYFGCKVTIRSIEFIYFKLIFSLVQF